MRIYCAEIRVFFWVSAEKVREVFCTQDMESNLEKEAKEDEDFLLRFFFVRFVCSSLGWLDEFMVTVVRNK